MELHRFGKSPVGQSVAILELYLVKEFQLKFLFCLQAPPLLPPFFHSLTPVCLFEMF